MLLATLTCLLVFCKSGVDVKQIQKITLLYINFLPYLYLFRKYQKKLKICIFSRENFKFLMNHETCRLLIGHNGHICNLNDEVLTSHID